MYWNPNKDKRRKYSQNYIYSEWQGTVQGEGHTEATSSIGIDYQLYTMATPCMTIHYISPF